MKKARRFTILLVLALCIGLLTVTASAASGTCGEDVTWVLDEDGTLTISGKGEMTGTPEWGTDMTKVVIEDGVTSIMDSAFERCHSLTKVTLPNSITTINYAAFSDCTVLPSVTIPSSVETIGELAFQHCVELDSIYFQGDAIPMTDETFLEVVATAFYPAGNPTWNSSVLANYGGTLTWVSYDLMEAPTVTASNVASSGKVKLTWNKVDGAASYKVYRATSKSGTYSLMKTTTATSYTNTSAKAGSTYYYYVVAVAEDGVKFAPSAVVTRTCDLAQPVVTASNVASSGKIKLTWEAVDGAVSYKVYRSTTGKDGSWSLMKTTTATSYTNTSAKTGTLYYYKVIAIASKSAANSAYSAAKSRTCDLARPVVSISNVASSGKIKLTWEAVDGAVSYKVYRSTTGKDGSWSLMKTTTSTSYTNTSAKAGTQYYYKVIAIASKSAANSAYSTAKYRTCDLARPVVTISLTSAGKPKLTWKAVDGAISYKVYRSTTGKDGSWSLMKTATATSYTNTSAKAGTTYYYKVMAVHSKSAANSAYSLVKSITAK